MPPRPNGVDETPVPVRVPTEPTAPARPRHDNLPTFGAYLRAHWKAMTLIAVMVGAGFVARGFIADREDRITKVEQRVDSLKEQVTWLVHTVYDMARAQGVATSVPPPDVDVHPDSGLKPWPIRDEEPAAASPPEE